MMATVQVLNEELGRKSKQNLATLESNAPSLKYSKKQRAQEGRRGFSKGRFTS